VKLHVQVKKRLRRCFSGFALAWFVVAAGGCAGPNAVAARAPVYEFESLGEGDAQENIHALGQLPFVVHFKSGESIPLSFSLESKLFDLEVPPLTVQTKRDIYLLFRRGGPPLLSEDGKNFKAPGHANSFMFGFNVQKGQETKIQAKIGIRPEETQR
jgi:hypothetical protein